VAQQRISVIGIHYKARRANRQARFLSPRDSHQYTTLLKKSQCFRPSAAGKNLKGTLRKIKTSDSAQNQELSLTELPLFVTI
jgi:hypothetical protein